MEVKSYTINEKLLLVVDNLLTQEECSYFIQLLDTDDGLEDVDRGFAFYKRNTLVSEELAQTLHKRLEPLLTQTIQQPIVLNTHFRFSKYLPGQYFDTHTDGVNQDEKGRKSFMTINIFLNDNFEGGETDFLDNQKNLVLSAKPVPGRGAIFDRLIYHRGNVVRGGFKYLIRTDIMYNPLLRLFA